MAILKDLIVSGSSRLLGKLYTNDIEIGNDLTVSGKTTTTQLHINTTTNPTTNSSTASTSLPFVIGSTTGTHLAFDINEIAAKSASTTASTLYLNYGGGRVNLSTSGSVYANAGEMHATTFTGTNLGTSSSYITNAYVTTAAITTANTNTINNATNIYNKNGTIETDVIKSNKWEIVSTQNLGGDFFVAPTIMVTNESTFTISSVSGKTITGTIKDTTNITSANFGGHTWSANSLIKITGKLTTGSTHYILGTCDGKLTAQMNNTANTINFQITCNASIVPPVGTYTITDGTVMMYNVGGSNKVGIYMTCYGTDKYTYIDIYNGSNGNTPVARLGKLDNLKDGSGNRIKVGDILTTDYGIYTSNGFFKGKVVANGGTIAGWTIGDGYITTNSNRTTYDNTSYTGMTMTASGIGARGSATSYFNLSTGGGLTAVGATVTGVITANTGYIGGTSGWTIAAQQLYNGTIGADNSLHLGTKNLGNNTSIGGRQGSDWRLTVGQHFGVTNTGAVYCNDIHTAGGTIGGFKIDTTSIRTNDVAVTSNADNSISLSSTDFTRTISGTSRAGLRFAIGDKFGVTGDGAIYASSATISGAITATSGSFTGGVLLNGGYLTTNSSRTTYNSTSATGITIDKNGIGGYASANAYFNMTTRGVLTAVGATVTGTVNATTGTFGNATNKITLGTGTSGHSSLRYGMTTLADTTNNGFYVGTDGIALGKGAFKVTSDGALTATSATIKGQINATSGFIGQNATNGFNITSNAIYNGISTRDATSGTGVYLGTTGINLGGGKFKVTDAGELTSTSGTIGGWTIQPQSLSITGTNYLDIYFEAGLYSTGYHAEGFPEIRIYQEDTNSEATSIVSITAGGINIGGSYTGNELSINDSRILFYTSSSTSSAKIDSDGIWGTHIKGSYDIKSNKYINESSNPIYQLYKGNNSSPFYIYGNNEIITRFATKTTSVNDTGTSFMIANGYYAAGSGSDGTISNNDINMYLCGGTDSTSKYIQSYPVYNRTYNYGANMYVTANGVFGRSTSSSIRYKHDVEYYTNKDNSTISESKILVTKKKAKENPESILDIPIVTFKYNEGYVNGEADFDYDKPILGLIAEDVANICPECATYIEDDDGNKIPEAWDEKAVLVRLLYVVQKQNEMIKELHKIKEVQKWQ